MQQIPLAIFLVSVVLLLLATAITSHYPKRGFLRAPSRWIDEEIRIEPHRQGLHHDQDAQSAIKGLTPDADRMASELKEVRERELEVRRRRLELEFEPRLLVARGTPLPIPCSLRSCRS
jgi:hypothetical protein